jgi:putative salt-induced outer membrane protein
MKNFTFLAAFSSLCCQSLPAWGQVTTGATEVIDQKPLVHTRYEDPVEDTTELSLQGGALVAGGNARTAAMTGATRFFKRFGASELTNQNALNYARTGAEDGGPMGTTVENYQFRVRYEYFFSNHVSAFMAVQGRRDRFQGLNLRLGVDPGLAYYFIRNKVSRFWVEGGYDFQYEDRNQATVDLAASEGTPIDKDLVDHNMRLFMGFDQRLDERLHLVAGLEYFKSLTSENDWRLNWDTSLNVALIDNFSLAIGSLTLYNNNPLPGVKNLDVTSSLSFVYTLL